RPATPGRPTWRSTTPSSSPPPSACTTATWTGWPPACPQTRTPTGRWPSGSSLTDTAAPPGPAEPPGKDVGRGPRPVGGLRAAEDRDGVADLVDGLGGRDQRGQPRVGLGDPAVRHHQQPADPAGRRRERVGRADAVVRRDALALVRQPDVLARVPLPEAVREAGEVLSPVDVGVVQVQRGPGRAAERLVG